MKESKTKFKIKLTFNAPATIIFSLICLVVIGISYMTKGKSNELLFMTYHSSLKSPLTYLRFFTHILGHANWTHFIGNISYILLLGPLLEEKYGSKVIIELALITAFITGIINYIFFPNIALYGASGVVFAYILLASFASIKSGEIPVTFILVAGVYIGQQIYQAIAVEDNVSQMAHIVGGVVGAACGFFLNNSKK